MKKLYRDFQTIYGLNHLCPLCGKVKEVICRTAIGDDLAEDWRLSPELRRVFDYREGCSCRHCGATTRIMNLALTLLEVINLNNSTGYQFAADVDWQSLTALRLAEINNCGVLHNYLGNLAGLSYSEYGSADPAIRSEDLRRLSYEDNCFDIVLTSDVLEHVPDYRLALHEISRVLKPDGVFILTVPWLRHRKTVVKAKIDHQGMVELLSKASYHGDYNLRLTDYLVFYEFGYDFVQDLQNIFAVEIYCHHGFGGLITSVFVCRGRAPGNDLTPGRPRPTALSR